ncbi:putative reverse transcriptase domain-containing protein [Tanacetum coccineum]
MENVPPPNNDLNVPKEEPIPEQALAAPVGFGLQWIGGQIPNNNNGWLKEDDEEDPKEDDDEDPEEDEVDEDNEEDLEKYDDEDLNEDEVGESSSTRALLYGNSVVFAPGPKPSDLMTIHSRTTKLEKQMFERYNTEIKIKKKFNKDNLHMNRHKLDVTIKYSKMKRPSLPEGLRFQEEPPIPSASVPRSDDLYVMARDVAMAAQEDDDDDAAAAENPQPLESRGSPRDQPASKKEDPVEPTPTYFDPRGRRSTSAVGLYHWFEKMENTFEISECAEGRKVKFATATLYGRALTWWNSQVATLGREVANERPWTEVKQMMIDEFCPIEEVQRLEDELRHLKLRDMNIAAYTKRFNELALLPAMLNEAVRMVHTLMEQKIQAKNERIVEGNKRIWETTIKVETTTATTMITATITATTTTNNVVDQGGLAPKCNHCEHNSSDLAPQRQEMFVKNVSSGLVPQGQKTSDYDNSDPVPPRRNVVPPVEKTDLSQQGLEFLFSPLL